MGPQRLSNRTTIKTSFFFFFTWRRYYTNVKQYHRISYLVNFLKTTCLNPSFYRYTESQRVSDMSKDTEVARSCLALCSGLLPYHFCLLALKESMPLQKVNRGSFHSQPVQFVSVLQSWALVKMLPLFLILKIHQVILLFFDSQIESPERGINSL